MLYGVLILAVAVFFFSRREGFAWMAPSNPGGDPIGKQMKVSSNVIQPNNFIQSAQASAWGIPPPQPVVVAAPPPQPIPAGCSGGPEGGTAYPKCPDGQLITGGTIRYGKWDGTTTPREKTVPIPESCKGRNNCGVTITNDAMGGDPYPNVFKQFLACPTCAPAPPPPVAPSMVSSSYAASCTKCTLVNNQLSCSCDVAPR